ncbi:MAG: tyrosine-type recombinase/integrase [Candidatus Nealsonbacteria bacterium]
MNKSNIPIIKHIPNFLDYCEVEKGLSDKTQKNYDRYLNKFKFWLKSINKENIKPHELSSDDIWKYRLFLSRFPIYFNNKKVLKKNSQNYYLIALRALLSYFSTKDILSIPADKIVLSKDIRKEKNIKFLNLEQIENLLSSPNTKTIIGLRDKAILEILFSTGLRIAELTALDREQFDNIKDKKDLELSIIGKGEYPRTVYFSERSLEWLKKYLNKRRDIEKSLFINYRARKDSDSRLTSRSIERTIKKYAILANIPLFTTPHTLRHSMATDLLSKGVDLRAIQEFLGHRSISSTQIYTHVTNKRLRDIHRKFHGKKEIEE